MSGLADLRKDDRSRVTRRRVLPEDGIGEDQPGKGGGFRALSFVVIYAGVLTGLIFFGLYAVLSWLTGFAVNGVLVGMACVAAGIAICAAAIFQRGPSRANAELRRQDFASGEVDELILDVAEAKAFREPEHGALMYFLKLGDGRVFYDVPGGNLPGAGWERRVEIIPEADLPGERLHLHYGTASGMLIGTRYSGAPVHPLSVSTMKGSPEYWPAEGTFRKTPWSEIEMHFAAR